MLICKFASAHSRPEQIHEWICYLERLTSAEPKDTDTRRTLEQLLAEARAWVGTAAYN